MIHVNKRLLAGVVALAGLLAIPSFAAGGAGVKSSADGVRGTQAFFVQLAGKPSAAGGSKAAAKAARDAFFANAAGMGVSATQRQSFDTLWNGVSVNVPAADAGLLASVPGVQAVYPVNTISLAVAAPADVSSEGLVAKPDGNNTINLTHSRGLIGADVANTAGFNGTGVKVAVIDSGIDYTHPDLGAGFGAGHKVAGGWDFVGDSFDSNSDDSTYQPIPHPDANPAPCDPNIADQIAQQPGAGSSAAAHGTHVAGIVGAKAASASGITGVAPGATLLAYRVFGCNGSTSDDVIIAALERAYSDGARVVNMSIGDAFNTFPDSPDAAVSSLLVEKGVVVVASAGNSGADGLFSTGAPSVGNGVISVASVQNTSFPANSFDVSNGTTTLHVTYLRLADTTVAPLTGSPGQIVYVGRGCQTEVPGSVPAGGDPYLANPSGKVALIIRGVCSFNEKYARAVGAGATAVVIMNDGADATRVGHFNGGFTIDLGKPGVTTTFTDGNLIKALTGTSTMTWTANILEAGDPLAGQISSFSSWGLASDLTLKPDVSAPGGNIKSTWPLSQFGGYNVISGTSMASPHVAGAAADYLQAHPTATPSDVAAALQNTGVPFLGIGSSRADSTARQGAGLIHVDLAIGSQVLVTPSKLSLGDGFGGSRKLTFTNTGAAPVTYSLQNQSALTEDPFGGIYPYTFGTFFDTHLVSFTVNGIPAASVTVPAGGSADVVATMTPRPEDEWDPTAIWGGFLTFTPTSGSTQRIRVPYAGFVGDYQKDIQAIQGGGCSLPALAHFGAATDTITCDTGVAAITGFTAARTGGTWSQPQKDPVVLLWHLQHQAVQLTVTLVDASTGLPFTQGNRNPVLYQISRVARNSTATSFGGFIWDGRAAFGDGKSKAVPAGDYKLVLTTVKPKSLTDTRANMTETWTSPVISLH
jgi:minor extracellular serine protease Vpr